jgi:acyl carrier protein
MDKINQILAHTFNLSKEEVLKNLGMEDVNNWDSLSHMNLIVNIEDEFKIELTGDDISEMITFDQIRDVIQKYI